MSKKVNASLIRAAEYLDGRELRCPDSAFTGLFFVLADDNVTYYRALRRMAKVIDPEAERNVRTMSQLTLIIRKWFETARWFMIARSASPGR